MNQVLTDFQMIQDAGRALRNAQKQLAEAQVQVADAMSTLAIFEQRFNFGEYTRNNNPGMILTTTPVSDDWTRVSAQMQAYMAKARFATDEKELIKSNIVSEESAWAKRLKCKCGDPTHGRISNYDEDYSKASDFVA